jgi:hypothetical protein
MAHKWDGKVNREVAHRVTCTLCGVLVERVTTEDGKWRNYHTPAGGERTGGLAPRCTGGSAVEKPAAKQPAPADAVPPPVTSAGVKLSAKSLELFKEIAEDMPNWSHCVPSDGNIQINASQRGNLTDLKKKGICTTEEHDGSAWISFTDAGYALSTELGYDLEQYRDVR